MRQVFKNDQSHCPKSTVEPFVSEIFSFVCFSVSEIVEKSHSSVVCYDRVLKI